MKRFVVTLAAVLCWLASLLLADGGAQEWKLAAPQPAVDLIPSALEGFDADACTNCHAEVAAEWASTAHAIAWEDEFYQEDIDGRKKPELCHGCHVPAPLLAAGLPKGAPRARTQDLHFGVSCESCHLGPDGTVLGPRGTPTDAHTSVFSESMTAPGSNALCSSCHSTNIGPVVGIAKDFKSSGQADRGRSCVGCHMAPLERSWANAQDGSASPLRLGRSHAIQTPRDPAFLAQAFDVSLASEAGTTAVVIANRAGHRIPGLKGRAIEFHAEVLDDSGAVVAREELVFTVRSYLPVDSERRIEIGAKGAAVRLIGKHRDPRSEEPIGFLDVKLEAPRQ